MQLFVDRLTNVDFSYLQAQRGLVGETWLAGIVLEGAVDDQGMICDFGIVKKMVCQWLDDHLDHRLLVPKDSPNLQITEEDPEQLGLRWEFQECADQPIRTVSCHSPKQAVALVGATTIDPQSVADWCVAALAQSLPDSIDRVHLSFKPESIQYHFYHYSHGLKKHAGNCQRIAHGHRSTVEIYRNGSRDPLLEQQWCQHWQDIYIGTREDLQKSRQRDGEDYYVFSYTSAQGDFTLELPAQRCYLIDSDTTVELIAQHIADSLKQAHPQQQFTVKAFEGIGKGAIVQA
ncbi:MAG: 6-pyruvoyl-tetrahydropterin synthase [Cellvibrionaceae bacterium]|jgi:6-pyruvoyl-tetrahydropterin synthase